MDAAIVNPFLTAGMNVFSNMFGMTPQPGNPYVLDRNGTHRWEVSGILGITGDSTGVVAFRLHKVLANKMLQHSGVAMPEKSEDREQLAIQLVSEFTNIISGNAVSQIKLYDLDISPPVVVSGPDHVISWPQGFPIVAIPFTTPYGPYEVDVCFK